MALEIVRELVNGIWRTVLRDQSSSPGGGLPAGGTTGEVLAKQSDADGDVGWDPSGGSVPFVGVDPPDSPTDGELWWDPDDDTPTPGGSQPVKVTRYPFAFDTPNLQSRSFAISLAASGPPGQIAIASGGDVSALFPVGSTVTVTGSTGNDGTYTVASYADGDVFVEETLPDETGDGTLTAEGAVGASIYTPTVGETILFFGCRVITDFDGDAPTMQVGFSDDLSAVASFNLTQDDPSVDAHMARTAGHWPYPVTTQEIYYWKDTEPLHVLIDNGGGLNPASTAGVAEVILVTAA